MFFCSVLGLNLLVGCFLCGVIIGYWPQKGMLCSVLYPLLLFHGMNYTLVFPDTFDVFFSGLVFWLFSFFQFNCIVHSLNSQHFLSLHLKWTVLPFVLACSITIHIYFMFGSWKWNVGTVPITWNSVIGLAKKCLSFLAYELQLGDGEAALRHPSTHPPSVSSLPSSFIVHQWPHITSSWWSELYLELH